MTSGIALSLSLSEHSLWGKTCHEQPCGESKQQAAEAFCQPPGKWILDADSPDPAKPDTWTGGHHEQEHPAKPPQIPDTQKLGDNKCLLFEMAPFGVICYTAMGNLYT